MAQKSKSRKLMLSLAIAAALGCASGSAFADGDRVDYVLPRSESLDYAVPWTITVRVSSKRSISTVYSPSHRLQIERISDRQFRRERVDMLAVDTELVVKMGAGCQPGLADVADDLALLDAAAGGDFGGEARHVAIQRGVFATVLDDDDLAVTAL